MTATRQFYLPIRDASWRRAGGLARFGYTYGYFTARAETV